MKTKLFMLLSLAAACMSSMSCNEEYVKTEYQNPVINYGFADPTVIDDRARTGYFYAYSTQNSMGDQMHYLPVYKSKDMVNWEFVCDGFSNGRPTWAEGSRCWAPDINYFNGHYVLYYALGVWGDPETSASGVAVSDSPTGPFIDQGMIVDWPSTGVGNSIDPNFFDDGDAKYLFWGSLGNTSGLWGVQLTDDGLKVKEGCTPVKLGNTRSEGSYVKKRNGYYYYFASKGSCCEAEKSTYRIIVARSENPLGPYIGRDGKNLIDEDFENVIMRTSDDKVFAGPGHDAQIITDDAGDDWMCYHTFWSANGYVGRLMAMDQIVWDEEGWPSFKYGDTPTRDKLAGPRWNKK